MRERRVSIVVLQADGHRAIVLDLDTGENIAGHILFCEENAAAISRALVEPLPLSVSLTTMNQPPLIKDGKLQTWQAPYRICAVNL